MFQRRCRAATRKLDFTPLLEELTNASARFGADRQLGHSGAGGSPGPGCGWRTARCESSSGSGASMRGARAMLAIRKAEALGKVNTIRPPASTFEQDEFDGKLVFPFRGQGQRCLADCRGAVRRGRSLGPGWVRRPRSKSRAAGSSAAARSGSISGGSTR